VGFEVAESFSFRLLTDNIVFEIPEAVGVGVEKGGAGVSKSKSWRGESFWTLRHFSAPATNYPNYLNPQY
jgi:hypothetical protein